MLRVAHWWPPMSGHEPLWTVAEVAEHMRMSRQWVYKAAELGTLPCVRFGASLRFDPVDVRRYVERQKSNAGRGTVIPYRPPT